MDFPYENHSARVAARKPSGLLCRNEAKSGRGWARASKNPAEIGSGLAKPGFC